VSGPVQLKAELFDDLDTPGGVQRALQHAIQLEHATIPPYLYALYSLEPGTNEEIGALIGGVVAEEMAHLALAANVLNAIGGAPVIDRPGFIPTYPGPLPGGVDKGLTVHLAPFSKTVVEKTFMVIEHPEHEIKYPKERALQAEPPQMTIGMFYTRISEAIGKLGEGIFTGNPAKQVVGGFSAVEVIPVTGVASAQEAIEIIIEQGEGTATEPLDPDGKPGDLAHYYRFAEIVNGRQLVRNPNAGPDTPPDERWSYTGPEIPCDETGVLNLVTDPTVSGPKPTYAEGTTARHLCDTFNYTYTSLLKSLHDTFNGKPDALPAAIGLMWSLEQQFMEMTKTPVDPSDPKSKLAAPSFEYQPVNPG
jgi:rubrerythrin